MRSFAHISGENSGFQAERNAAYKTENYAQMMNN